MTQNRRPLLLGVHGAAVGIGIALAIQATAEEPRTPQEWVLFCLTAADDAYESIIREPPDDTRVSSLWRILDEMDAEHGDAPSSQNKLEGAELEAAAQKAAETAFRMCMPKLLSRRHVQAFIACVAASVQRRYLSGNDAKGLLYTCQLALAAHPSRSQRKPKR